MSNKEMTPQEVTDYKRKWMSSHGGYGLSIHSDIRREANEKLKEYGRHKTCYARYTEAYEDTAYFEDKADLLDFYQWYKNRFTKAKELSIIEFENIGVMEKTA